MKSLLRLLALVLAPLAIALSARAAEKPSEIRVSNPGVGVGNRPVVGGSAWALLNLRGALESEFKGDGFPVRWNFLRGAGPAVNETYANGLTDFSLLGDLPSIIGRAGGLKTRILASGPKTNLYIAVPADSPIQSVKDLKGKRFAVFKGTCLQLSAARILEAHGLSERDVRAINMDNATTKAALATKDVDAAIGLNDLLAQRDQGLVRIIYSTKGDPRYTCNSTIIGSDDFIRKYPEVTKRVVRQYVLAAKWLADQDKDLSEAYRLWARSGTPFASFKEDWAGESAREKDSPLVDAYVVARYKTSIADAKRLGLIRATFDFEPWVDRSFLDQVLKEEKLEGFWKPRPAP
ncbi:ABC transporter substrate-binding protein [Sorangium sp. So ce385]|uniref:ABC transporter substrate-binding protein n=1 Tax=Sorangium sp. So ce385 TaxID=3133308 RepID=UPI003F5B0F53